MELWSLPPAAAAASVPVLRGVGPVPLGGPAAGDRMPLSPGAGPQHRFNLAFMCHRARERLSRGGGNAEHLDGGTAAVHGGGGRGRARAAAVEGAELCWAVLRPVR